jgi:hypothetical protein
MKLLPVAVLAVFLAGCKGPTDKYNKDGTYLPGWSRNKSDEWYKSSNKNRYGFLALVCLPAPRRRPQHRTA